MAESRDTNGEMSTNIVVNAETSGKLDRLIPESTPGSGSCITCPTDYLSDAVSKGISMTLTLFAEMVSQDDLPSFTENLKDLQDILILRDESNFTLLHVVVSSGRIYFIRPVIKRAKELGSLEELLNVEGQGGLTPLLVAAKEGHIGAVNFLVHEGADMKQTTKDAIIGPDQYIVGGKNVFHLAAESGHFKLIKALMKRFPNTDLFQEDANGYCVYELAQMNSNPNILELLHIDPLGEDERHNRAVEYKAKTVARLRPSPKENTEEAT